MKHFISCALLMITMASHANGQTRELRFGLIGKLEFNRLVSGNAETGEAPRFQPGTHGASGLYLALSPGKWWFTDASVLLSRASYSPGYRTANAELIDADIRFTQVNLNLNLVLNPNSGKVNLFVFAGGQLLYRRWGEERYNNGIIPGSYWPSMRIMANAGLGAKCHIGRGFYMQPFAGLRHGLEQQIAYDTPVNQYFAGLVLCYGTKGKVKNRYERCPTDF